MQSLPLQSTFISLKKNPQMCPAHRDPPTPSRHHSRLNLPHPTPPHTHNGLTTFHPQHPVRPFSSIGSASPPPSNTAAYRHKSTKLPPSTTKHSSQKKPEGCAEGPRLCGPFAVFLFSKKYCAPFAKKSKRHTVFQKKYF